ncbi:hypothetical protein F4818DRAFT_438158 [Hypoxylon cercidicola]|nr:hypothetical protein F4818DRAFT_438158 [Hypoxylon cercidicola]
MDQPLIGYHDAYSRYFTPDHVGNGLFHKAVSDGMSDRSASESSPTERKTSSREDDTNVHSPSSGETSGGENADGRCPFSDGIVDQGYKSAFFAKALKHYLLDSSPEPFQMYPCLMADCQESEFKTPKEMLRHLEGCTFFRDERWFRCPTCDKDQPFQVTSKRCPFSLVKFSQRFHEKFKDFFSSLLGSSSSPESYQAGRQSLACDVSPQYHPHPQRIISACELPNNTFYELPSDTSYELPSDTLYELQCDPLPQSLGTAHPYQFAHDELGSLHCPTSGQSILPVQPYSAAMSQAGMSSTGISPTTVSEISSDASYQIPTNSNTSTGGRGAFVDNHEYARPGQGNWQLPRASQLFELPARNSIPLQPLPNQPDYHGNRGPSLTIDTNYLRQEDINTPAWGGEQTGSGGASWSSVTLDIGDDSPPSEVISPTLFDVDKSSPMNFEADPDPLATEEMQDLQSFDFSPIDSTGSPSSPEQSPGSELTSSNRCHHPGCGFAPTGKPKNHPAYLRKHRSVHERKTGHPCPFCKKTFTRKDNWRVHYRKAHSEIGSGGL